MSRKYLEKKKSGLIPKPGKDNYNESNAHRTVSVTSCLGKRFEFISSQRLISVLNMQGFDKDQYAYLKNRSVTLAILIGVERIKRGLLKGDKTAAVFFLGFTDAFGTVNRRHLLRKISKDYGFSGRRFLHIASFLKDRLARIKTDVNVVIGCSPTMVRLLEHLWAHCCLLYTFVMCLRV